MHPYKHKHACLHGNIVIVKLTRTKHSVFGFGAHAEDPRTKSDSE